MKRQRIALDILTASLAVLSLASCQKRLDGSTAFGEEIKFCIVSEAGDNYSKAAYSGVIDDKKERIDWKENDRIRIYCAQAVKPAVKWADYTVTSVTPSSEHPEKSTAHIKSTNGLVWGEGDHTFYAAYPSPAMSGICTGITGASVTASLPAAQAISGDIVENSGKYTANPDVAKNMLMTAKGTHNPKTYSGESVSLNFIPLTTAVKFTIINRTGNPLSLQNVSLTSESCPLNGAFTVNLDNNSTPDPIDLGNETITYTREYPGCAVAGTVDDSRKTVSINLADAISLAYDDDVSACGSFTFTFFMIPTQDLDDLTFKLTKSDTHWMSTKLSYTNGSGILFPRFMKTEVKGILVPGDEVQWTIKYVPNVYTWEDGLDNPLPLEQVEDDEETE